MSSSKLKRNNSCFNNKDKVYKNIEIKKAKENDTLGGIDPYGASKSATVPAKVLRKKFLLEKNKAL